jgi:hypothetical protein
MSSLQTKETQMPNSNHTFTDINDILESVFSPEIKYNVCNSVVWRAGTLIITECQRILKGIKEEARESAEYAPEDFVNLLREDEFMAEWLELAGMTTTAHSQRIADLFYLRNQLIEQGEEAAGLVIGWDGNPRTFTYSTIHEELDKPVKAALAPQQERRIKMDVERQVQRGRVDEKYKDRLEGDRLKRAGEERKRMADAVMSQRDLVTKIWDAVEKRISQNEVVPRDFHEIDADLKSALLTSVLQGAERAKSDAENDRRMTDGAYDMFLNDYYKFEDLVGDVLKKRASTV